MNRFKKDTRALGKIGFLIFIILLVVIATVGGNAALPFTGDQKIAAGDYLEYQYSYTLDGETTYLNVKYTFTAVTIDEAVVNVVYTGDDFNMTVEFSTVNNALAFTWPNSPDNSFDIFDFMHIMDETSAEKTFAFQNVGLNIILMDSYTVEDYAVEPWWAGTYTADEIIFMVKMGTNIPIYMEMTVDDGDFIMTIELIDSSISWITLI